MLSATHRFLLACRRSNAEEVADGIGNWYVPGSMPAAWVEAVVAAQNTAQQ